MTIQDLCKLLQTQFMQGQTLTIRPSDSADLVSPAIKALLSNTKLFPMGRLLFSNCSITTPVASTDPIIVEGTMMDLLFSPVPNLVPVKPFTSRITIYLDKGGTPQLKLDCTMSPAWKLSQAFQLLDKTDLGDILWGQAGFLLASADSEDGIAYKAGLNFSGILPGGLPLFVPLTCLFNNGSNLTIHGPIQLAVDTTQPPIVLLSTDPTQADIRIGSCDIEVWIAASAKPKTTSSNSNTNQPTSPPAGTGTDAPPATMGVDSSIVLNIGLQIPNFEPIAFSAGLSSDQDTITLSASLQKELKNGLSDLNPLSSGQVFGSVIPPAYPMSLGLSLGGLSLELIPDIAGTNYFLGSVTAAVALPQDNLWTIIPDVIAVEQILVAFKISDPLGSPSVTASVLGAFEIGNDPNQMLGLQLSFPDFSVQGGLEFGKTIDVAKMVKGLFGDDSSPDDGSSDLKIDALQFSAQPSQKTYSFQGGVSTGGLNIPLPGVFSDGAASALIIESLSFYLNRSPTFNSLSFYGTLQFLSLPISLSASKTSNSDASGPWTFGGRLTQPTAFSDVVKSLVPTTWGLELPAVFNGLTIDQLGTTFTPAEGTYSVDAAFDWQLSFAEAGPQFDIAAALNLRASKVNGQKVYSGQASGSLDFNGIVLSVIYRFAPNSKTIVFQYETMGVTYATSPDPTLSVSFGDATLADLINFMIELADPGSHLDFPSPWSKLLDINLNGLIITIHLKTKEIEVTYMHDFNFGFVDLQGFTISYRRQSGKGRVWVKLFGNFLGQSYGPENPLAWDVLEGDPPAVASGGSVFEIMYVGLGQHVALKGVPPGTVEEVIAQMKQALLPPADPSQNPVSQMPNLVYDAGSGWMIGGEFLIENTFHIALAFNDPNIYGLLIDVSGHKAGALQGLKFEVEYRKITDEIGVYHIDFMLPWQFRHIEMGEVAITLPEFILDIYTNGNFKIDAGFPPSVTDFSKSFAIEIFPFIGFGGFYFASLDGETASNLPYVTNGHFGGVVEFGIAMSIGVGKTIQIGPLSGGAFVTLLGELQGTFASFQPSDSKLSSEQYFDLIGTAALVGQIYGSVDFVLIKASISITVYAEIRLEIQSYEPILIDMSAGVEVSASVKILFVRIHFHFGVTVHLSFSIGSHTQTPWIVGPDPRQPALHAAPHPMLLESANDHPARAAMVEAYLKTASSSAPAPGAPGVRPQPVQQNFIKPAAAMQALLMDHPASGGVAGARQGPSRFLRASDARPLILAAAPPVATPAPQTITLWVNPLITKGLKTDIGDTSATGEQEIVLIAPLLTIPTSADSTGSTIKSVVQGTGSPADFDILADALLKWAIETLVQEDAENTATTKISAIELLDMKLDLMDPDLIDSAFDADHIRTALSNRGISFKLAARSTKAASQDYAGALFPMPPFLSLTSGAYTIDFGKDRLIGSDYTKAIDLYLEGLAADFANPVELNAGYGPDQVRGALAADDQQRSFAAFIFSNYFVAVLRQLVQASITLLQQYSVPATETTSLISLAQQFQTAWMVYRSRSGDTLLSIAELTGLTPEEILEANEGLAIGLIPPGTAVTIPVKVTAAAILGANWQTAKLFKPTKASGVSLTITNATHLMSATDSLSGLSALGLTPTGLLDNNADTPNLFAGRAALTFNNVSISPLPGDSLQTIAANFGASAAAAAALVTPQGIQVPHTAALSGQTYHFTDYQPYSGQKTTLAQILAELNIPAAALLPFCDAVLNANPPVTNTTDASTVEIEIVTSSPCHFATLTHLVDGAGFSIRYRTVKGDTIDSLLARFYPAATGQARITAQAQIVRANPGISFLSTGTAPSALPLIGNVPLTIPVPHTPRAIASLYNLGASFGNPTGTLGTLIQSISGIFSPQATLNLPSFQIAIVDGDTFESISRRYNLDATELCNAIAGQTGYFADGAALTVPQVPAITVGDLLAELKTSGAYNTAANMVSRFFLHGLRLPEPGFNPTSGDLSVIETKPLYALAGQEFEAPSDTTQGVSLVFQVTDPNASKWLSFDGGGNELIVGLTTDEIGHLSSFGQTRLTPGYVWHEAARPYNWVPKRYPFRHRQPWTAAEIPDVLKQPAGGLGDLSLWPIPDSLSTAMSAAGGSLRFELSGATRLADGSLSVVPMDSAVWATTIDLTVQKFPALDGVTPAGYLLRGSDDRGAQTILDLLAYLASCQKAGEPETATSYLLYPPNQASGNSLGYLSGALDRSACFLLKTNLSTLAHPSNSLLAASAASPTDVRASLMPADMETFLSLVYECSVVRSGGYYLAYQTKDGQSPFPDTVFQGSDTATITLLVVLENQNASPGSAPLAFNTAAVYGQNVDTSRTHIFASQPVRQVVRGQTLTTIADSFAGITVSPTSLGQSNADLLSLLRPGTRLTIPNGPSHLITPSDTLSSVAAALKLPDAGVLCATFADNQQLLAPGSFISGVPLSSSNALKPQAALPPGTVGFTVGRPDPSAGLAVTLPKPEDLISALYNLMGFKLLAGGGFAASAEGVPIGPTDEAPVTSSASTDQDDDGLWSYRHFLKVSVYAPSSAPGSTALPSPADDPYAGTSSSSLVTLDLTLQDILGNRSSSVSKPVVQPFGLRFTDEISTPDRWPGMTRAYRIDAGAQDQPVLTVTLAGSAARYVPSATQPYIQTSRAAAADAQRIKRIWYQLQSLSAKLSANRLGTLASLSPAATLDEETYQALLDSAAQFHVFIDAASRAVQDTHPTIATDTLALIAASYSISAGDLAKANASIPLAQLFASSKTVALPSFYTTTATDTLTSIGADAGTIASDNPYAPLKAGLTVNRQPFTPADANWAEVTLASLTQKYGVPLDDLVVTNSDGTSSVVVAGLATANSGSFLQVGLLLTLDHNFPSTGSQTLSYATVAGDTLAKVAAAFQSMIVDGSDQTGQSKDPLAVVLAADVGAANSLIPGLFVGKGGTLPQITAAILPSGATLADVAIKLWPTTAQPAGSHEVLSATAFLQKNADVPGLFQLGTSLIVGDVPHQLQPNDTFETLAVEHGCLPEVIGGYHTNITLAMTAGLELTLPYSITVPAGCAGVFRPAASSTLKDVRPFYGTADSGLFHTQFAAYNGEMPGLFAPGTSFAAAPAGTAPVLSKLSDTPESLARALGYTSVPAFIAAIEGLTVLRPGAVILTPALMPAAGSSFAQAVSSFRPYDVQSVGLTQAAADLALANASVRGVLQAAQPVNYPGCSGLKTEPLETLTTLAARIGQALGASISPADVITANSGLLINSTALISPPGRTSVAGKLSVGFSAAFFPLNITMSLWRDHGAVEPAFYGSRVELAEVPIPADSHLSSQPGSATSGGLKPFAAAFEKACPGLKIAIGPQPTAQELGSGDNDSVSDSRVPSLWAVNFNPQIGPSYSFQIHSSQFRFFSLAPIATTPWTAQGVSLDAYVSGAGIQGKKSVNVSLAQPDAWADSLLQTVDTVLNPAHVLRFLALDAAGTSGDLPPAQSLLTKLLAAKAGLADRLVARTANVLLESSTALDVWTGHAREALRQQILVTLDSAYTLEGTLQYPFQLASAETDIATAPRLYGKPTPRFVNVGKNTSLAAFATALNLAPGFVLDVLQNQPLLLATNVTYTNTKLHKSYVTGTQDTLATVAAAIGAAVEDIASGVVTVSAPMFDAGAGVRATKGSFVLSATSQLADIADYFQATVAEILDANQNLPNLFASGQTITLISGKSCPVAAEDTAATLARKLGVTLEGLADDLWANDLYLRSGSTTRRYLLTAGETVGWLALSPQVDLAPAAISVASGTQYGDFLFTIKHPEQQKSVLLDLDFQITDLQFRIDPNGGTAGYETSSWLRFITPYSSAETAIGQVDIPIVLREMPQNGTLGDQQVVYSQTQEIVDDWAYQVDLTRTVASQDTIEFVLGIDCPPLGSTASGASSGSTDVLFTALASFDAASKDLAADLAPLAASGPVDAKKVKNAVQALVTWATAAQNTWPDLSSAVDPSEDPINFKSKEQFRYTITPIPSDKDPSRFEYLKIVADPKNAPRYVYYSRSQTLTADMALLNATKPSVPPTLNADLGKLGIALSSPSITAGQKGGWNISEISDTHDTVPQTLQICARDNGAGDQGFLIYQIYYWPSLSIPSASLSRDAAVGLDGDQPAAALIQALGPITSVTTIVPGLQWMVDTKAEPDGLWLQLESDSNGNEVLSVREALTAKIQQIANTLLVPVSMSAFERADLRFYFADLDVLAEQNAASGTRSIRNQNLIPGQSTNPFFIYHTPATKVPNPLSAFIVRTAPLDITGLGKDLGTALGAELKETFSSLAAVEPDARRFVSLQGVYRFSVGPGNFQPEFPLTISTTFSCPAGNPCSFAAEFAQTLEEAVAAAGIPASAGTYRISLQILADLADGIPGASLLELDQLLYHRGINT
jgi:LysM repeat protein